MPSTTAHYYSSLIFPIQLQLQNVSNKDRSGIKFDLGHLNWRPCERGKERYRKRGLTKFFPFGSFPFQLKYDSRVWLLDYGVCTKGSFTRRLP
jgi:hypothetical protein